MEHLQSALTDFSENMQIFENCNKSLKKNTYFCKTHGQHKS